ncbi:MAG TPA: Ig-like domain-containing protein, partial [Bacteroidales bacterium]|nr:Ig-like domain-containing protein [Bacteroidales bacterium]
MKINKGLGSILPNSEKKSALLILVIAAFIFVINGCTKEQVDKSANDMTGPEIVTVNPANNSTITTAAIPEATFSEQIDESTLSAAFIVKNGDNIIPGNVTYSGMKATFIPSASLQPSTVYTCTITTSLQDISGNSLETEYIWSFTTASAPDVVPPSILSVTPPNNSTSVQTNNTLSVMFSEALSVQTVSTSSFFLKQGSNLIQGTVSYSGTTAMFTPASALQNGTVYSATVTTSIKDVAGNTLGTNYTWTFTTAAIVDNVAPTVLSVIPFANSNNVATSIKPSVTFSESMNQSSVSSASFTVKQGSTALSGTISWSGNTATFTPSSALLPGTSYSCTITTAVRDAAGNPLAANYTWTFTTVASAGKSFSADVVPILNSCNSCHNHNWTAS